MKKEIQETVAFPTSMKKPFINIMPKKDGKLVISFFLEESENYGYAFTINKKLAKMLAKRIIQCTNYIEGK